MFAVEVSAALEFCLFISLLIETFGFQKLQFSWDVDTYTNRAGICFKYNVTFIKYTNELLLFAWEKSVFSFICVCKNWMIIIFTSCALLLLFCFNYHTCIWEKYVLGIGELFSVNTIFCHGCNCSRWKVLLEIKS